MTQSRSLSGLETLTNVVLGWLVALITQALIFPVVGVQVVLWQHLMISSLFFIVSSLRSYILRRFAVWMA